MIDISGTRRHDLIVTLQRKIAARMREIDRLEKEIAVVKAEISTGIRPAIYIHPSKLKRMLRQYRIPGFGNNRRAAAPRNSTGNKQ